MNLDFAKTFITSLFFFFLFFIPYEADAKYCDVELYKLTEIKKVCVRESTAEKLIDRGWGVIDVEMQIYLIDAINNLNKNTHPIDPLIEDCNLLFGTWTVHHEYIQEILPENFGDYVSLSISSAFSNKNLVWKCMERVVPLEIHVREAQKPFLALQYLYHPISLVNYHPELYASCYWNLSFNLTDGSAFCAADGKYLNYVQGKSNAVNISHVNVNLQQYIKNYDQSQQECGFLDYPLFNAFDRNYGNALLYIWSHGGGSEKYRLLECIKQMDEYRLLSDRI